MELMNLRQVFNVKFESGEGPDLFKFCPHCAGLLAEKADNTAIRKFCPACDYIQY